MELISTNNVEKTYSLTEALTLGLAPDGGLFIPADCTVFDDEIIRSIPDMTQHELYLAVAHQLIGSSLSIDELDSIVSSSLTFPAPLIQLREGLFALELFHGPSLAFKDFGAQFMARLLSSLIKRDSKSPDLLVLVATSGDTGGAVAAGFHGVPGIRVAILYPKGGVSELQEKQLTTFGDNVHAIEIEGTFDDCQSLVKQCFNDQDLRKKLSITSANSINIGRLIPQSFYYFDAFRQLKNPTNALVFSVPSGNFGNLTAGLIAKALGLPIHLFLAATNINDVVPQYLRTGLFQARPSIATISNAMDVGNPSNFARMIHLFQRSTWNVTQQDLLGFSFDDQQTINQIKNTFAKFNFIADPHGAIALGAAEIFLNQNPDAQVVALQTAHASKFINTVESAIDQNIELHPSLAALLSRETVKKTLPLSYGSLVQHLYTL